MVAIQCQALREQYRATSRDASEIQGGCILVALSSQHYIVQNLEEGLGKACIAENAGQFGHTWPNGFAVRFPR